MFVSVLTLHLSSLFLPLLGRGAMWASEGVLPDGKPEEGRGYCGSQALVWLSWEAVAALLKKEFFSSRPRAWVPYFDKYGENNIMWVTPSARITCQSQNYKFKTSTIHQQGGFRKFFLASFNLEQCQSLACLCLFSPTLLISYNYLQERLTRIQT